MSNLELYNNIQSIIQAEIEPYKQRIAELEAQFDSNASNESQVVNQRTTYSPEVS